MSVSICILRHAYFPEDPTVRKEALALVEAGHSVDIICLRRPGQPAYEEALGTRVFRIPLQHKRAGVVRYLLEYGASFFMMAGMLTLRHLRRRYQCVQVNTMPDFLVFATLFPKLAGTKVLLHLHEPTPEVWVTKYGPDRLRLLRRIQERIEQAAIRFADHALAVTETLRQHFGSRGADIDKITVIPNVCEESFQPEERAEPVSEKSEGFTLITHGTIEERYGHEEMVRAVHLLRDEIPGLRLNILGEGEYKERIVALVEELGCSDRVHFVGFLPFEELLENLRAADAGIIAMRRSPYSDLVDTTKMYEYIALRKPVIASRLKTVERNFGEECLELFEPGDPESLASAIRRLYHQPQRRQVLVRNASERFEHISWKTMKFTYLEIVEALAGRKNVYEKM